MRSVPRNLAFITLVTIASAQTLPNPLICEDSLDNLPPFNSNEVPCLIGCGTPIAIATGSLLPGSINATDIPYCQLNCVHKNATPSQSALAPGCYQRCQAHNQGTPENVGWCMYWCADGLGDLIASTSCVPSLEYGAPVTTVVGGMTETIQLFTTPAVWESWYQTQTVLSRTADAATIATATSTMAQPSSTTRDTLSFLSINSTSGRIGPLFGSETGSSVITQGQTVTAPSNVYSGSSIVKPVLILPAILVLCSLVVFW